MKEPKFTTPCHKLSDCKLVLRMHRILDFFDKEARSFWRPGDMFTAWDWPTMRRYFPDVCDEYSMCIYEAKRRLVATAEKDTDGFGVLNGVKYVITDEGWKPIEEPLGGIDD